MSRYELTTGDIGQQVALMNQFPQAAVLVSRNGVVLGGIPPALQILGEICSNFFECTPPTTQFLLLHFSLNTHYI